uniref:AT-rich interactive domain protein n=1 Tax=Aeluropus littoralis TaxID=110874 RepID=A0A2U9Q1Q0_9POAL|nr:AT-rich interactive domain protein [Aeluropus littoralis]
MSQIQSFSKNNCVLLAMLCGKHAEKRAPTARWGPEAKRPRPSYPFPELSSAGRLEVHTLFNPAPEQFLEAQRVVQPNFLYIQGQQQEDEKEIGSLVWGDNDVSDPQAFSSLISPPFPTIVYLEVPIGEKLAQAVHSKGIPYVIYWRNSFSSYAASHFRHALMSVIQSSLSHTWDSFQLAHASFRLYCVEKQFMFKVLSLGLDYWGDAPKINICPPENGMARRESPNALDSLSHTWDSFQLAHASFRLYCVRNNHVQSVKLGPRLLGDAPKINICPPENEMAEEEGSSEVFPSVKIYDEEINMKFLLCGVPCTLDACLSGSLEDGLNALLNIEIRGSKLQNRVSASPPPLEAASLPRGMVTMRCDISTCSSSHVSLLVSGSAQTCFDDQLLDSHIKNEIIEKSQLVRALPNSEDKQPSSEPLTSMSIACGASTFEVWMALPKWAAQVLKHLAPEMSYRSLVALGIGCINGTPVASFERQDADRLLFLFAQVSGKDFMMKWSVFICEMVCFYKERQRWFKIEPVRLSRTCQSHHLSSIVYTCRSNNTYQHQGHLILQSLIRFLQSIIQLNPLPMKKHGCIGCPFKFALRRISKDVMQFLIQRGHNRLVPHGGLAEFPDAILNAKRLDLYNLYKEFLTFQVVSRGGFYVGNGINWKGQVFSKMRSHTATNRMTGVGNTLKRHYETYLLEYELAHDDVDGECCLLCHSSAPGDWVNCGLCGEWAHFGCDRRQGLGTFKDYAKTDGLEYICPHCSLANYKKKPPPQKVANGFANDAPVSRNG